MRESIEIMIILSVMPIFLAVIAVLATSKLYAIAITFPLLVVIIALALSERPQILINLSIDRDVMYVGDELNVKLTVNIHGGFGLLMIRAPPLPNSSMAEGFDLVRDTNVHVMFKGFKDIKREFNYVLRAVKRGYYDLGSVEYVFYNGLGIHEPIRGSIRVDRAVQVLPRIKIVRRVSGIAKPRHGLPRYPPSRLGPYSTDFRSVREYVVGDPYRFINWKATARNPEGKFLVNDYEREGIRNAVIIMDVGWWMRQGTVEENPLEYGISLVLSLSRILLRYGYNVGLWSIPSGPRLMPSSGMEQYYRLLRALMVIRALPTRGYVLDGALLRIVRETRPVIIIVTNVTKDNAEMLSRFVRALPTRTLIVDIVPDTVLVRTWLKDVRCVRWFIRDRTKLYTLFPRNAKVMTWDPACEGIGLVIAKLSTYIGKWL